MSYEIIVHHATIPLPAFCNDKRITLSKAKGSMTKPQERFVAARKRFVKELVKRCKTAGFSKGISVNFGFTSQLRNFIKAGFKKIGKVYAMQKDMRFQEHSKVLLKNQLGKVDDLLPTFLVDNFRNKINLKRGIVSECIGA